MSAIADNQYQAIDTELDTQLVGHLADQVAQVIPRQVVENHFKAFARATNEIDLQLLDRKTQDIRCARDAVGVVGRERYVMVVTDDL